MPYNLQLPQPCQGKLDPVSPDLCLVSYSKQVQENVPLSVSGQESERNGTWDPVLKKLKRCDRKEGFVYFVQGAQGTIKIGFSRRPSRRLGELKVTHWECCPIKMLGWIPGSYEAEGFLHQLFSDEFLEAEWFVNSPRLMEFISLLNFSGAAR